MLGEVKNCQQVKGEPRRRWFADESLDLIVWFNPDGTVHGFQLCYDKERAERALTWIQGQGYTHRRVDTGEMYGRQPDSFTPILVPDGQFDAGGVARCFLERCGEVDPDLVTFVLARLRECGPGSAEHTAGTLGRPTA